MSRKHPYPAALLATSLVFLPLAGCGSSPEPQIGRLSPSPIAELGQADFATNLAVAQTLHSNDIISVSVFREPDLSAERIQIAPDGTITMPFLGLIKVEGKTAGQVAQLIRDGLRPNYLTDPQVSVNVIEYGSHQVTVEGAVKAAGLYDFKPGTRLSGAIARAGGLTRVAKLSQVAIFRPDHEGMLVAKYDYGGVMQGTMVDPVLMPNDRIIVGTSGLSQFYQDLLQAIPAFALFTRIL